MARRQLLYVGVPASVIGDWTAARELHVVHRGVYAVGHTALSTEGWLTAGVLYAGPEAMLSHGMGGWWLSLTGRRPAVIQVSLLDIAATQPFSDLRYALAQAEFHGYLDLEDLHAHLGQGKPGSARLRRALERHEPQLARTRSEFERRMLFLCERYGLPIPEFNVVIHGYRVDALWRERSVVVELDGKPAHSRWGQIQNDRERDLALRSAGALALRYTWRQLDRTPAAVAADIERALAR